MGSVKNVQERMNKKMTEDQEKMIICPLCGYSFVKGESQRGCESCPLNKNNCGLIRCPNCGYEFPEVDNISLMDRVKKFFNFTNKDNDEGGK